MKPMSQDELAYNATQIQKLRGAPITLIFALALCGGPMNNLDFQLITGYSAGTVTSALKQLTLHSMVVSVGKAGWVLADGMRQLPLFTEAMLDSEKGVLFGEAGGTEDRKIYDLPPSLSSSSSRSINYQEPEEEERKPPQHRKIYDHQPQPVENPVDNSIQAMLIQAGVGRNSPKLRQILATNPNPQYIRAWVHYYHWWQQQHQRQPHADRIDNRTHFTTGTLITCILDNDPIPTIPQPQSEYRQYIPPELEHIIRR